MMAFFTPGDVADLASQIESLSQDPVRRAALVANTEPFYLQHSWSQVARNYANLVDSLQPGAGQAGYAATRPANREVG
jgi:hypothetical protein